MNRLIYYPTGCYGTFVQWLCNTQTIAGAEDLPFHTDGNSHRYVLSDQYRLLISAEDEQEFFAISHNTVASCIWPLDHNGKIYNELRISDFYSKFSQNHLQRFVDADVKTLVIHPTDSSKIWWYHNNCKKVFYTPKMFERKIKNRYAEVPWLTTTDVVERAQVQMSNYYLRPWYLTLLKYFNCGDASELTIPQLRTVMAHALHYETFDYLSHWSTLSEFFPNVKFVTLDQLRDNTQSTIEDIFEYFDVASLLPLDCIIDHWTLLQTTRNRDAEHDQVVNCIVNHQSLDWSTLNFDLFDEVYLYYTLKFKHGINLDMSVERFPTNTEQILSLVY